MTSLFLKDEDLMTSPPILGYKILALMHDRKIDKISIFDIADFFKNKKWFSVKNMYFAIAASHGRLKAEACSPR